MDLHSRSYLRTSIFFFCPLLQLIPTSSFNCGAPCVAPSSIPFLVSLFDSHCFAPTLSYNVSYRSSIFGLCSLLLTSKCHLWKCIKCYILLLNLYFLNQVSNFLLATIEKNIMKNTKTSLELFFTFKSILIISLYN